MGARRTVAQEIAVEGVALHAEVAVRMRLCPSGGGTGIRFCRSDLAERPVVAALWNNVLNSRFATVISENGVSVFAHGFRITIQERAREQRNIFAAFT